MDQNKRQTLTFDTNKGFCEKTVVSARGLQTLKYKDDTDLNFEVTRGQKGEVISL